jgi:hypothetical protein
VEKPDPLATRYRDSLIIRVGADPELNRGEPPVDIVARLSAKPVDISGLEDREIDAPLIVLETDRTNYGISAFYLDPPTDAPSIPTHFYLMKWGGFSRLLLSEKIVGDMRQTDYAFALLSRAVQDCRDTHGVERARALTQALHDNRWAVGPEMSAELFTIATFPPDPSATASNLSADHAFLTKEIAAVRGALSQAKASSSDLTEWCESLYSINPRVWALLMYLRDSDLPDAETWYRYFAEVDADIAPCSLRNVFQVIHAETGESGPAWHELFISTRQETTSITEFRQKLQFLLHTRTTIPKYWFDLAVESYELAADQLPDRLTGIDPFRAVSTDVLRSVSMRWRSGPA